VWYRHSSPFAVSQEIYVVTVQAVIWDFGGVLTSSPFDAFNRYEAERGLPKDFIRGINARNPYENAWAKFERSDIDVATFDALFDEEATAQGHSVRGRDVLELLGGDIRPEMVEALRRISEVTKTGCITNNVPADPHSPSRKIYLADIMALFHHVIESSKLGIRKPDPRIYRMMTDHLGVDPKQCIYLDDLGINLKPARDMGMKTIKVAGAAQALDELEAATGMKLR
jgi:putative hydrolase of the HAD superfamily